MLNVKLGVTLPRHRKHWVDKVDLGMRVGLLIVAIFAIIHSRC